VGKVKMCWILSSGEDGEREEDSNDGDDDEKNDDGLRREVGSIGRIYFVLSK
jgi:hypothetical protein